METLITLNGVTHTFETKDGKTELKLPSQSTPSEDKKPPKIKVPNVWLITRKNGFPLFAVRPKPGDKLFRIITADKLYAEKIQWFEPLSDNYRERIWLHPDSLKAGSEAYAAYKHFTWKQIIDFAIVDRWPISFAKDLPGDWKANSEGGDGFLMVIVGSAPYWTDGIGQIPFAVDTFRKYLEELRNKPAAVRESVLTGMEYGDGNPFAPAGDATNEYDNFMVLRGALWASENFQLVITKTLLQTPHTVKTVERTSTVYQPGSSQYLQQPISASSLAQYGKWKK
jgi:hypothetical protein